jgi:hypothetical protein
MRYAAPFPVRSFGLAIIFLLAALGGLVAVGGWVQAIAIFAVTALLMPFGFLARLANPPYVELTDSAVLLKASFSPATKIPYDIISGVKAHPARFFWPARVSLKLSRWRWSFVPLPYPSKRYLILVGDTDGLASALRLRANLLSS